MATAVVIPDLGESISEAVVAAWLKADGDYVERDQDIVELETDKVTMPLPAPVSGLLHHTAKEGDTLQVGAVLASIDESAPKPEAAPTAPAAAEPALAPSPPLPPAALAADDIRSTPLARKVAVEHHVDLHAVPATGPGGRVRQQDVLAHVQSAGDAQPPALAHIAAPSNRTVTRTPMSQLRRRIAVRLVEAQHTAAMLTTFNECDMTRVIDCRARMKDAFIATHGVKLGFMSFFIKACVNALQHVPDVNSFLVDADKGPEIQHHAYCDIAVAVGTDKGLVVPVLRDCQTLSFAQIEQGIADLATKARDRKLALADLQGGTFTISNGGVYGSMLSTPILNPPQSGILGMHNIIRRPVENPDSPGSGDVVIRPMMYLALSYDHRIVDGQGAVTFLKHVKDCIEDPQRLLLDL